MVWPDYRVVQAPATGKWSLLLVKLEFNCLFESCLKVKTVSKGTRIATRRLALMVSKQLGQRTSSALSEVTLITR